MLKRDYRDVHHSGNSSLHIAATAGGVNEATAIWQDITAVELGESYTLSYWTRRGASAAVWWPDWAIGVSRPSANATSPGRGNNPHAWAR